MAAVRRRDRLYRRCDDSSPPKMVDAGSRLRATGPARRRGGESDHVMGAGSEDHDDLVDLVTTNLVVRRAGSGSMVEASIGGVAIKTWSTRRTASSLSSLSTLRLRHRRRRAHKVHARTRRGSSASCDLMVAGAASGDAADRSLRTASSTRRREVLRGLSRPPYGAERHPYRVRGSSANATPIGKGLVVEDGRVTISSSESPRLGAHLFAVGLVERVIIVSLPKTCSAMILEHGVHLLRRDRRPAASSMAPCDQPAADQLVQAARCANQSLLQPSARRSAWGFSVPPPPGSVQRQFQREQWTDEQLVGTSSRRRHRPATGTPTKHAAKGGVEAITIDASEPAEAWARPTMTC